LEEDMSGSSMLEHEEEIIKVVERNSGNGNC
jgi:hypothetical protein